MKETERSITKDHPHGGEVSFKVKAFECTKLEVMIIPPNAEHRGNAYEFGDIDNIPMKKECDQWMDSIPDFM